MSDVYELYRRGTALLEARDYHAATVALARARDLDPEPTSIREALGRAYFHARQHAEAAAEFEAVVQLGPTNDYALFCLGRSLQQLGRHAEARRRTTTRCSASVARCSSSAATPRHAAHSRWPPACGRTAGTTGCIATSLAPRLSSRGTYRRAIRTAGIERVCPQTEAAAPGRTQTQPVAVVCP